MKTILTMLFASFLTGGMAQQKVAYYDWDWKPSSIEDARFAAITRATDSGWVRKDYYTGNNKLQMVGLYSDSNTKISNGWFSFFYSNGTLSSFGKNIRGKKEGLWLSFHSNGMISDSTFYENGKPVGISIGWYSNGMQADSISREDAGWETVLKWFDNGAPAEAGRRLYGKLHGTWQFFRKNGTLAAKEVYDNGSIVSVNNFDETGKEVANNGEPVQSEASFKGKENGWQKHMEKYMYFPAGYQITNSDKVTVVISASIDEEGNVVEPMVEIPFKPQFDEIALNIFIKSPRWKPSMEHNRAIPTQIRQPVTFRQQ